ncbi:MAG: cob(I)yrinic acid a,c-diamide adenosyltransferase [Porphyromonas sp.]|nr:cob(I)yrinic acid a,c-diamide adenosyltransferase [Porphyromonas sp.]
MEHKKSKLYTKGGDKGKTSLVGGQRVSKASPRIEAYGTVDELNSWIGMLRAELGDRLDQDALLSQIQHRLFEVGSYLATDNTQPLSWEMTCGVKEADIHAVERAIDTLDASLPELKSFILPAGGRATATSHLCRTVSRRAERRIYQLLELVEGAEVEEHVLQYINRLSDYFFILARAAAHLEGGQEVKWEGCH